MNMTNALPWFGGVFSQPHDLLDDPVAALDGPDKDEQVKHQLAHIAPYCGYRRRSGVDRGCADMAENMTQASAITAPCKHTPA